MCANFGGATIAEDYTTVNLSWIVNAWILQYKEAFLKANPDYKWFNPDKHGGGSGSGSGKSSSARPSTVISAMLAGGSHQRAELCEDSSTIKHKLAGG